MSMGNRIWQTAGVMALAALVSTSALAQVSARFVVPGGAATSTKITPGGAATFEVRIDAPAPAQNTYGTDYALVQSAPAAPTGVFTITGRVDIETGSNPPYVYNDASSGVPNATVLALPGAVLNPQNTQLLGRTTTSTSGTAPASNILATTLTLTSAPATALGTYTISAATGSSITTTDGAGNFTPSPMSASFTIVVGNQLTVTKSGTGAANGLVVDAATLINCGVVCTDIVPGSASLTASAPPGTVFTGWTTGPCAATTTSPCVVSVAGGPVTVNAQFDLAPQTMTVIVAGAGTGTVASVPAGIACPGDCTEIYPAGTVVTLTATPTGTSSFTGWTGAVPACVGTGPCVVTMNQVQNVTATFGLQTFNLTVNKAGFGTGNVTSAPAGIACATACTTQSAPFQATTVVTLTATADAGKVFTGWSGVPAVACPGTAPCVVTINAAQTVTATFGDTQLPTTTVLTGPASPSNSPNPVFTFSADESPVVFRCSIDGSAPVICTSPYTGSVGNGSHVFSVFATDPAGNAGPPATFAFTTAGVIINNVPIPTLNEWMLVLLAMILGTAGMLVRRRKN